ncbi:MAG: hypothetical protein KDJ23_13750 [Rhodoblastus sp.]|nr:hypothetical protein [Nitratireductor sp.]MCB1525156.1 hypothetical protein [Rhodoblastus sp.]
MIEGEEKPTASAVDTRAQGLFGHLRYYVTAFGLGLYDFVYGCFFASSKKDVERNER